MYTIMIMYFIKLILILVFNTCINIHYIYSECKCCCGGQPKTPELITSNNKKIPTKQKDNITKQLNINDKKEEINKINNKDKNSIEENDKGKDKDNKEENNIKENYKNKDKDKNKSKKEIKQKEVINKIDNEEGGKDINDNKNEKKEEFKEEKKIKEKIKQKEEINKIKKKEGIKEEKKGKDDDEEENYEEDDEKNEEDDEKNEEDDEKNEEKNTENKENNNKEELKTHFENILICLNILYHDENFVHYIIKDTYVGNTETIKKDFNDKFYCNTYDNKRDTIFRFITYKNPGNDEELNEVIRYMDIKDLKKKIVFFENVINQIIDLIKEKYEDNLANYIKIKDKFTTIKYTETNAINNEYENLQRQVKVTISSINLGKINEDNISIKEIDEEKLKTYLLNIEKNINIINTAIIEYFKKLPVIAEKILEISDECDYYAIYYKGGVSDEDKEQFKKNIATLGKRIEKAEKGEGQINVRDKNTEKLLDNLFNTIKKNIEEIYLKYLYVIYIDDFINTNIPEENYKPTLTKDYRSSFIFSLENDNYEDFVKDTEEEFTNIKNLKFFKTLKSYENDAPLAIFNRSNIEFKDLEIKIDNLHWILMSCLNEINDLEKSLAKEIPVIFPNLKEDCKKILEKICPLSFMKTIYYLKNDDEYKNFKDKLKNNLYTENILEKYKTICESLIKIMSIIYRTNDRFKPVDYFEDINNELKKYIEKDKKNSDERLKINNEIKMFILFRESFIKELQELRKILLNEISYDLYVISNCLDYIYVEDKTKYSKIVKFMKKFKEKDFEIKIIDNNNNNGVNMEKINKILVEIINEELFAGCDIKQINKFLIENRKNNNRVSIYKYK